MKEPPQDFYCPVTYDLLLQPRRTSCCGQNLSHGAVARLQREGETCPLCRESEWRTELNGSSSEKWAFFVCFVPTWTGGASGRGICMDLTVMFRPVP